MFCSTCGNELYEGCKFCTKCGSPVLHTDSHILKLKCEECGGTLTVDSEKEVISCPYCGSKKLLLESDTIKVEKIKSETEVKINDSNNAFKINKAKINNDYREKIFTAIIGVILIIFMYSFLGFMVLNNSRNNDKTTTEQSSMTTEQN